MNASPRYSPQTVNRVVAMLTGAVFIEFLHRQALAVAMRSLGGELHLTDTELGSLVTAFALAYAVCGPLLGRAADRVSRRSLYAAGIATWSAATALGGIAVSFSAFFATRLLTGAGQASAGATNSPLLVDYVVPERRGGVIAIVNAGATLGALTAGVLGFVGVLDAFGWRGLFLGVAALGLVFAVAFRALVPEPPRGWSEGRAYTPATPVPLREVGRAVARRPALLQSYVATILSSAAIFASAQWIVAFFERAHGMSNRDASLCLVYAALASTAGAVAGGVFANRAWSRNPRAVLLAPALSSLLACPALWLGVSTQSRPIAIAVYALSGGLSLFHSAPASAAMQGMIPDRMRGFVSSLIASILTFIGLGCGPLLTGALSDFFGGDANPASLGRALAWISLLYAWAALHFALAARTLKRDLDANAVEERGS